MLTPSPNFMRTFIFVLAVTGSLALHPLLLRAEPTHSAVAIPVGKLAFVTSKGFGYPGKIRFIAGQHQTTTLAYETRDLEFLPDGRQLIYSANDPHTNGMFVYDLASHTSRQVWPPVGREEAPCVSPDGSHIAFVRYAPHGCDIYCANVDGSDARQLTTDQKFNWSPRWSPDGRQILFETTRNDDAQASGHKGGGHRDAYVMDPDGGHPTNLTPNNYGHQPSWSPDGKAIAYMSRGPKGSCNIFVMHADGSAKQDISHGTTRDSEPVWSPDGQWIAFTRTVEHPTGGESMDIWLMKSDGTEQTQVTFNEATVTSYSPRWGR